MIKQVSYGRELQLSSNDRCVFVNYHITICIGLLKLKIPKMCVAQLPNNNNDRVHVRHGNYIRMVGFFQIDMLLDKGRAYSLEIRRHSQTRFFHSSIAYGCIFVFLLVYVCMCILRTYTGALSHLPKDSSFVNRKRCDYSSFPVAKILGQRVN